MAITCISRVRDHGVFHDFAWPADLPNFGHNNLIYGWNGSGKTTLSRLFRALETRTVLACGLVTISIALARSTLEENYLLPNTARRLLEAFLAFRQPHVPGDLWQKVKGLEFDETREARILRFLHTYHTTT